VNEGGFQLTASDVRAQEFGRAALGYDKREVEEFKERMADELDRLLRERFQLQERLRGAQEQLRTFQDRERAINDALVSAQELRGQFNTQAEREAELIRAEARQEAEEITGQARRDEQLVQERLAAAERQFHAYVASFRALLDRQLVELEALDPSLRIGAARDEGDD
jgi:DivIVA domain-containing protein